MLNSNYNRIITELNQRFWTKRNSKVMSSWNTIWFHIQPYFCFSGLWLTGKLIVSWCSVFLSHSCSWLSKNSSLDAYLIQMGLGDEATGARLWWFAPRLACGAAQHDDSWSKALCVSLLFPLGSFGWQDPSGWFPWLWASLTRLGVVGGGGLRVLAGWLGGWLVGLVKKDRAQWSGERSQRWARASPCPVRFQRPCSRLPMAVVSHMDGGHGILRSLKLNPSPAPAVPEESRGLEWRWGKGRGGGGGRGVVTAPVSSLLALSAKSF